MTTEDFYKLVEDMRATQKKYFRTRDANVLNKCKELETAVDKAIAEYEEEKQGGTLF